MTNTDFIHSTPKNLKKTPQFPLGQLLALAPNHHFFHLPILMAEHLEADLDKLAFVLFFQLGNDSKVVAATNDLGYSEKWQSVSYFSKEELKEGLTLVPLLALASCQVLALPLGQQALTRVQQLYPDLEELSNLQGDLTYNPYRDAYEAPSQNLELIAYQANENERDYEQELCAFELSRKGEVKQIPLIYHDQKRGQKVKLYVRGWYLFDNQPPLQISWKPAHTRKASWRSSYVSVDNKTGDFFFRGELYKGRQAPIFLKSLSFGNQQPSHQLQNNWKTFKDIIEAQKTSYLDSQAQDN